MMGTGIPQPISVDVCADSAQRIDMSAISCDNEVLGIVYRPELHSNDSLISIQSSRTQDGTVWL